MPGPNEDNELDPIAGEGLEIDNNDDEYGLGQPDDRSLEAYSERGDETPAQAEEAIQDALNDLDEQLIDKSDLNNICIYADPTDKTAKRNPVVKITTAASGATKVTVTNVNKLTPDAAKAVAKTRPGFLITKGNKSAIIALIDKFGENAHKIKLDYNKLGLAENDAEIAAAFQRNPPVAKRRP